MKNFFYYIIRYGEDFGIFLEFKKIIIIIIIIIINIKKKLKKNLADLNKKIYY